MKSKTPDELAEQVRTATLQLQQLHAEMRRALFENALDLRQVVDGEELERFKGAVDDIRGLAWPQVLAFEQPGSANAQTAMQLHRLRRIRSMLEALKADDEQQLDPQLTLFLEEIERLVARRAYAC